ncbi:hypothetical protein ACFV2N_45710 [Streptomyces sp. NPDC059680]|uniref:hypothetical protein n=1 Tax=Streptomyces sp. NPDC059680 TaxID=3346904 RepID=UPI003698E80B
MPVDPSLTRALAEALVDVLWFVDGCEDERMDPDDAVGVLEGVAYLRAPALRGSRGSTPAV